MSFDAFRAQFMAHIEGTAPNERETIDSADEAENDPKKSANVMSKKGTDPNRTSSHFGGDQESIEQDKKSHKSKTSAKKSNIRGSTNMSLNKTNNDNFKFEIPPSCFVTMIKKVLIEKMDGKWFLASHPYPKIEGEMIIFKPKKGDQTQGKDAIVYRDFSLRKRIETTPKD
jgi:hypothetical protein